MALREIAVGIDGSKTATDAFSWAAGLGRTVNAKLQAVHAWETPYVCTYPGLTPTAEESIRHARSIVRTTIEEVGVDEHVDSIVVRGAAGPALTAQSSHSDLLVIGRTGKNLMVYTPQFGEIMAGATARYCANHAGVPVATVPIGSRWVEAPNVAVGIDGSPTSLAALTWATEELPADASIHALVAVDVPTSESGVPIDVELLDPLVDHHRQHLQEMVAATIDESFTHAGRSVTVHVVAGYAQDALTNPGFPCDLIVVGEHGDTAAAPGVLGSIADHTMRYAQVPLVVVPSPNR